MAEEKVFAPKPPKAVAAPQGFKKKQYQIRHCLGDKKICFSISGDTGDGEKKGTPFNLQVRGDADKIYSFPGMSSEHEAYLIAAMKADLTWIDEEVKVDDKMEVRRRRVPTFSIIEVEQDGE